MLSIVVHAPLDDEDPPGLTDDELYMFFSLLFWRERDHATRSRGGGNALMEHPDQLAALRGRPRPQGTAIEEVLRWTNTVTVEAAHHAYRDRRAPLAHHRAGREGRQGGFRQPGDELEFPDAVAMRRHCGIRTRTVGFGQAALLPGRGTGPVEMRVMYDELPASPPPARHIERTWQQPPHRHPPPPPHPDPVADALRHSASKSVNIGDHFDAC
jgi:hypothetical protein